MRLSIQRLRWVLVAGALLLVAVLGIYIGSGRYRALKAYRRILARSGVSLTHDSSGVTYSQSLKGRKIFTIRAKSEVSLGDGKYALHDAEMLLYTRSEAHPDHIYGSQMQYDENAGILRANGEVFMDLQPPQGLTNGGRSAPIGGGNRTPSANTVQTAKSNQIIHVRTSGLVYARKLGLATTAQQVEFSYGGMQCTALGAEFNTSQSTLRLLSDVSMDGLAHGQPLHITAIRADIDRNANVAHLTRPVATSDGRRATSDAAIVDLRKDGSIQRVQGIDHVVLSSATQQITADRLDATLSPQSVPQTASLSGSVVLTGSNPLRPMHGSAAEVDAVFNAQGTPTSVIATGAAKLSMVDRKTNPAGLARSMDGDRIVALFTPGKRRSSSLLKEVHATGSAHTGGQSIATPAKTSLAAATAPVPVKDVQVWADDLRILFITSASGKAQPQTLFGAGHTLLQQDAPLGEEENSSGDTLKMVFASAPTQIASVPVQMSSARLASSPQDNFAIGISSAVQTGHVIIHDRAADRVADRAGAKAASAAPGSSQPGSISNGSAARATYDGASQRLTLAGDAHLFNDNASLTAPIVSLDQRTQAVDASGGVQAVFQNAPSAPSRNSAGPATAKPQPETHILSASAHFDHATQLADFYGTDAQPARLWQGASQVQAATLLFDGIKRTFSARPARPGALIHAVFASNPAASKSGAPARAAGIVRVASPKMDYSDLQHEATFSSGVVLEGDMGQVRGQQAVLFLSAASKTPAGKPTANDQPPGILAAQPDPLGGSIDRVVVDGSVQLDQPGRHGTGEQLLYTASSGSYVLTGTPSAPPRIVDAQQGTVTGTTLLFSNAGGAAGSTIVVSGNPNSPRSKGGRVRSETRVSPAKEERQ